MARLNLSLLGTFQVILDSQPITRFRSANNQALLAYLALQSEKPIAREVLVTLLWPDESEKNGRNNLRQSLFQLRKLLDGPNNSNQRFLLVTRQSVQFNPHSDFILDVQQFLQAIDNEDLETAVSHYHGDLLPGLICDSLEFENWLRQEREQLHNLALEIMAEFTQNCLQNGRIKQAQHTAQKQIQLEPWHEQAHRQLMKAFVLAGNRTKALLQFELCQTVLMDELGLEPALETVTLFEDIKAGFIHSAVADNPLHHPANFKHNLPIFTNKLLGRELEIDQISKRFMQENQRLVSIVGSGGMGKTRLAIAAGTTLLSHFHDGVYFVDLAPLNQKDEIQTAIAITLNYQASDKNHPLFPQLLTFLRKQKMLLILDNFEHLLEGAELVNTILLSCPNLAILVTSRQHLALVEENRFELRGLDFPDKLTLEGALQYTAVRLFLENGRRVQNTFSLTENNVADVVRICQLVQGMPLGLLLAASWLALLSPAEIASEIENSLDFLAAELTDLPARQHSMQVVFEYSWQMLTSAEQTVLAKLSVFRGGFTRDAAEQVAGGNLRQLLSLVSKSLVQRHSENGRFSIHELLRQFAISKQKRDEFNETNLVHCTYFAGKIKAETQDSIGLHAVQIPSKYAADRDNLHRAWEYALKYGNEDLLANLAPAIAEFKSRQGKRASSVPEEAIAVLQQSTKANNRHAILQLLLLEQTTRSGVDNNQLVKEGLLTLLPTFEKEPYPELLVWLYFWIAYLEPAPNSAWYNKAHDTAVETQNEWLINTIAVMKIMFGLEEGKLNETLLVRLQELLTYFEPKLAAKALSDSFIFYFLLTSLQRVTTALGAFEHAIHYSERCLTIAKKWQELMWIDNSFADLAKTYLAMGIPHKAKSSYLASLEWHLAIGQAWQTIGFLAVLAKRFPQFVGGIESVISIFSMIIHHSEVVDYHLQEIDEVLPQFKAEIGEAHFAKAWEEGKKMDFETTIKMVRTSLESGSDKLKT